ncbi:unnamed protein product [Paramecium pentaurelia]|uniref:Uncharacterized protein n=1 Tax=Paramecium pentaurelia TaxID=43138 RepID=A0A8S1SPL0_9CILI|nr:unnamed protein product [Paramecium pentaurelia]
MQSTQTFEGRNATRTYTGNKALRKLKENRNNTAKFAQKGSPPKDLLFSSQNKFRVGPPPQPLLRAQQFSAFGPSRSTKSILARNNFLNGQPSITNIKPFLDFNQFMKGLSSNNVKPRSPETQQVKINKSKFCRCKEVKDLIRKDENDTISINNDMSPKQQLLFNTSLSKPSSPTIKGYLNSKKDIYKQLKNDIDVKKEIYSYALKKMLKEGDEEELMDFDHRYLRSVRQRKLRNIVRFLLGRSKEQQVSLQDLIDNKMTQYKPFQQQGSYSFLYYVKKGLLDKVEVLLQQNNLYAFDFDEKQMTGLHIATQKNNLNMIKLLITYNSNPLSKDLSGFTPLHYAIKHNNIVSIQLFLSIKVPTDCQYPDYCKLTDDQQILKLIRTAKINDLIRRTQKHKQIQKYLQSIM